MLKRGQDVTLKVLKPTLMSLDILAHRSGISREELIGQYIIEGMRMDEFPNIHFRRGVTGRHPIILGSRITVWQAMETIRNHKGSLESAAEYLSLPLLKIKEAARYYRVHQNEVDRLAKRELLVSEQAEQSDGLALN